MVRQIERRKDMRRRTFDWLMSAGGVVVTVVLIVAGSLLFVGYSFANNTVHTQLSEQKIFFPPAGSEAITSLPKADATVISQYAGQQVVNGAQAEAYANHFIAVHLNEVAGGQTYAEVSGKALQDPTNTKLQDQANTLFKGTTLRGMLLNAYAFWEFGQIAFIAMWAAFGLAAVMAMFTILGFWHLRKVEEGEELKAPTLHVHRATA
jgi:cytochrome bd-type quinol oxidase subunit 2